MYMTFRASVPQSTKIWRTSKKPIEVYQYGVNVALLYAVPILMFPQGRTIGFKYLEGCAQKNEKNREK